MTLPRRIALPKMSPPTDEELLNDWENDDGDIDRWENDGGMNFG